MAQRRCLSEKIVESDAFYALKVNEQALYLHLNQSADDDGFVNNAANIAARIKGGRAALGELVKRRFLLKFGDVYVIKHWRISNSLKNDRLKPLTYASIAEQIWIKPNRAYTDHAVTGCKTLYEVKTGIKPEPKMESTWNPLGILTEPNRIEPNRTEPNRTGMEGFFSELWNDYPELRRGSRAEAMKAFSDAVKTEEDADKAIANLDKWKRSERWGKDGGQYVPYMSNWIARGQWQWVPEEQTSPAERQPDAEEIAAIARMLADGSL